MSLKLGIVMDPISTITAHKDSSFAMLLEAMRRKYEIYYMEAPDVYYGKQTVAARMRPLTVKDDKRAWYTLGEPEDRPLRDLDVILMRKDPPFSLEYIYVTYLLELAEKDGVFVMNKPQALRDANEKCITAWFPECCPPTLISADKTRLRDFHDHYKNTVLKPLEGMGGRSVFYLRADDPNVNVVIEDLTQQGQRHIMAQLYIPEIATGDKRILVIDGKPIPYALNRIPPAHDSRGNLAIGAKGSGVELTERDHWICDQIAPTLRERGIFFAGIDVIGDYLTEINLTSPTGIREIDAFFDMNICDTLFTAIERAVGLKSQ